MHKGYVCHCSVEVKNLSVVRGTHIALRDVSFSVKHGEILALIGRNGAGKTTILKAIINSVAYRGEIKFFNSEGQIISSPKIGYVPQKLSFDRNTPITVLDLFCTNSNRFPIWLGHSKRRISRAHELLEKVGAGSHINKPIGRLSGGELQRVMLAFALDPMPDILLLDEPVSAVDRKGVEVFYKLITSMREEFHMPAVMVSHDLAQVSKYATSYALIDGAVIETGRACELAKSEKVRDLFGFDIGKGGI